MALCCDLTWYKASPGVGVTPLPNTTAAAAALPTVASLQKAQNLNAADVSNQTSHFNFLFPSLLSSSLIRHPTFAFRLAPLQKGQNLDPADLMFVPLFLRIVSFSSAFSSLVPPLAFLRCAPVPPPFAGFFFQNGAELHCCRRELSTSLFCLPLS